MKSLSRLLGRLWVMLLGLYLLTQRTNFLSCFVLAHCSYSAPQARLLPSAIPSIGPLSTKEETVPVPPKDSKIASGLPRAGAVSLASPALSTENAWRLRAPGMKRRRSLPDTMLKIGRQRRAKTCGQKGQNPATASALMEGHRSGSTVRIHREPPFDSSPSAEHHHIRDCQGTRRHDETGCYAA